jgi:putative transposase
VSVSRPPVLAAGDGVRFRGEVRTVTRLAAGVAYLGGLESAVALADLFADPEFAVVTAGSRAPLPPEGLLEGLPAEVTGQARWWERHIAEVVSGQPADAGADSRPRPEYDPAVTSLRQREIAKAAELRLAGYDVPLRTLQRLRRSYETDGVWGWSITGSPGSPRWPAGSMSGWLSCPPGGRGGNRPLDGHRGPAAPQDRADPCHRARGG